MNNAEPDVLNCRRVPALLTYAQAGRRLGFREESVAALVRAKLLTPLGRPPQNGRKYLAAVDVEECAQNRQWLEKASRALYAMNQNRNEKYAQNKSETKEAA